MSKPDLCKELEDVREQIEKILDKALVKLYSVRNKLAKIIVVDAGLIKEYTKDEEDKYAIYVVYIDLMHIINALQGGEAGISADIDDALKVLGCRKEEEKEHDENA